MTGSSSWLWSQNCLLDLSTTPAAAIPLAVNLLFDPTKPSWRCSLARRACLERLSMRSSPDLIEFDNFWDDPMNRTFLLLLLLLFELVVL